MKRLLSNLSLIFLSQKWPKDIVHLLKCGFPVFRYAGIFWYPLGHVLCLHQRLVADQCASAASLHWWRPAFFEEAPRDRMWPKHPWQPGSHRPPPGCCPRKRGHLPPPAQVWGWSAGDWLSRKHSTAPLWPCRYHTVPGLQWFEDRYLVRSEFFSPVRNSEPVLVFSLHGCLKLNRHPVLQ